MCMFVHTSACAFVCGEVCAYVCGECACACAYAYNVHVDVMHVHEYVCGVSGAGVVVGNPISMHFPLTFFITCRHAGEDY